MSKMEPDGGSSSADSVKELLKSVMNNGSVPRDLPFTGIILSDTISSTRRDKVGQGLLGALRPGQASDIRFQTRRHDKPTLTSITKTVVGVSEVECVANFVSYGMSHTQPVIMINGTRLGFFANGAKLG